jgi:MFS family permease
VRNSHAKQGVNQGAIGSALAAGSVVGAIMAGPISDKFGRRDAILFACLWWLVGTSVQVSTHGIGQLIAGRIINGICVGITSSQVPVYLAEIAKKDTRGSIVVIQQLAIEFGILVMYFVGYGCSFIGTPHSTASFRTAWGIQFVPVSRTAAGFRGGRLNSISQAFLLLCLGPLLPRSPRWLAKVGRSEEAIDILSKIQVSIFILLNSPVLTFPRPKEIGLTLWLLLNGRKSQPHWRQRERHCPAGGGSSKTACGDALSLVLQSKLGSSSQERTLWLVLNDFQWSR